MTTETILKIAERNLHKAHMAMQSNYERNGVSEQEKENLINNVEYTQLVYDLVAKYVKYPPRKPLDSGSS